MELTAAQFIAQLDVWIQPFLDLQTERPLNHIESAALKTLQHFLRRPDLAKHDADFAIRRALPEWWLFAPLWWDNGEASIYGSWVERQTVRSIREQVIAKYYRVNGVEVEQLQPPGEYCYSCRQWKSKQAFNWRIDRGSARRESYCLDCQKHGVRYVAAAGD